MENSNTGMNKMKLLGYIETNDFNNLSKFLNSIKKQNEELLSKLLKETYYNEENILHIACEKSDIEPNIIILLLEFGVSTVSRNNNGKTPFHILSEKCKNPEIFNIFFDKTESCLFNVDNWHNTPLHSAIASSNEIAISSIMEQAIKIEKLTEIISKTKNNAGYTPLMLYFLKNNNIFAEKDEYIQKMIHCEANYTYNKECIINYQQSDVCAETFLHLICETFYKENPRPNFENILQCFARFGTDNPGIFFIKDKNGNTPIHLLFEICETKEQFEALLEWVKNTKIKDEIFSIQNNKRKTPIHILSNKNGQNLEVANLIRKINFDERILEMRDNRGFTPVMYAISSGNIFAKGYLDKISEMRKLIKFNSIEFNSIEEVMAPTPIYCFGANLEMDDLLKILNLILVKFKGGSLNNESNQDIYKIVLEFFQICSKNGRYNDMKNSYFPNFAKYIDAKNAEKFIKCLSPKIITDSAILNAINFNTDKETFMILLEEKLKNENDLINFFKRIFAIDANFPQKLLNATKKRPGIFRHFLNNKYNEDEKLKELKEIRDYIVKEAEKDEEFTKYYISYLSSLEDLCKKDTHNLIFNLTAARNPIDVFNLPYHFLTNGESKKVKKSSFQISPFIKAFFYCKKEENKKIFLDDCIVNWLNFFEYKVDNETAINYGPLFSAIFLGKTEDIEYIITLYQKILNPSSSQTKGFLQTKQKKLMDDAGCALLALFCRKFSENNDKYDCDIEIIMNFIGVDNFINFVFNFHDKRYPYYCELAEYLNLKNENLNEESKGKLKDIGGRNPNYPKITFSYFEINSSQNIRLIKEPEPKANGDKRQNPRKKSTILVPHGKNDQSLKQNKPLSISKNEAIEFYEIPEPKQTKENTQNQVKKSKLELSASQFAEIEQPKVNENREIKTTEIANFDSPAANKQKTQIYKICKGEIFNIVDNKPKTLISQEIFEFYKEKVFNEEETFNEEEAFNEEEEVFNEEEVFSEEEINQPVHLPEVAASKKIAIKCNWNPCQNIRLRRYHSKKNKTEKTTFTIQPNSRTKFTKRQGKGETLPPLKYSNHL